MRWAEIAAYVPALAAAAQERLITPGALLMRREHDQEVQER